MIKGSGGFCKIEGCGIKHYSKGLCRNHYILNQRNGRPDYKYDLTPHCKIQGCKRKMSNRSATGYCAFHQYRIRIGIPVDVPLYFGVKGINNNNWNGGTSEYPNHYILKKNRKQKLLSVNNQCEWCGGVAQIVHRKDGSKNNHNIENLTAICFKCHVKTFRKPALTKYRKLYGFTIKELRSKHLTWLLGFRPLFLFTQYPAQTT